MRGRVITFSNLFPSQAWPTHGLFVRERMRRVVAETGLEWTVVCPVPLVPRPLRRGDYTRYAKMPEREVVDGVEVWHPRYRHWPGISTARQARRMAAGARSAVAQIAGDGPAVLDAHYVYPDGIAALRIGDGIGLPTLVTARGTDVNVLADLPSVAAQIREWLPRAHARLAVSEPLRQRFAQVAGMADDTVELVRNGVDLERFCPGDPASARAALELPAEGALLLGVGRLVASKGFHFVAQALAELDGVRLVLVGDGPERDRLLAAAPGRVIILGAQPPERVALAYRACDVAVLPSDREGWPNVVTEALASGTPVVASDVGAVPEMVSSAAVGAVVALDQRDDMAPVLARVLAAQLSPSGIHDYARRFSWDAPVQRVSELLESALA